MDSVPKRSEPRPAGTGLNPSKKPIENISGAVSRRVLYISIQAIFNAIIIGLIAKVLVELINLITNLSFYGSFSFENTTPTGNTLGLWVILVPVLGGVLIGIMARLGSPAIRGHGIPEAMEQILTNQSKINPLITFLKPISAAISIGTGGPFGAEGPIISTGGALGSFAGQIMNITPNERKIMLTAGATAGMAAIFGTPIAAVLLAIELLLFEFSPRSIIPVALACATGAAMHILLFGKGAVFGMPEVPEPSYQALCLYTLMGAVIGVLSALISKSIYLIEDAFEKLPVHWMWWPAIGAVAVGVVGYFAPYTLGVGYDNIVQLLSGNLSLQVLFGLGVLKFISWSISLGSGTSGGTLAPLLTMGGAAGLALGILLQSWFPGVALNPPTCALVGMAAMFAGSSRALLTAIVFAFESTMQANGLLPLLAGSTASYFVSFFMMKGSIMTEKIQRRGIHTPDAYEPDLLQSLSVSEAMLPPECLLETLPLSEVKSSLKQRKSPPTYLLLCRPDGSLAGMLPIIEVFGASGPDSLPIGALLQGRLQYVYPESRLSLVIEMMDRYGTDALAVVQKNDKSRPAGLITASGIFSAYRSSKHANESLQRAILIRRQSYKMWVRGRSLFQRH